VGHPVKISGLKQKKKAGFGVRKVADVSETILTSLQPSETSALGKGLVGTSSHAHRPSEWKRFRAALCSPLLVCFWVVMSVW